MPANTSKSNSCRCGDSSGCCQRDKQDAAVAREPGFFGKRPWLFIVGAFLVLFAIWGTMFTLAYSHQPKTIPLVSEMAEH